MALYHEFLEQSEFGSYEDYLKNFKIKVPENFNFAYDVVDVLGKEKPEKLAMIYLDKDKNERKFTFKEMMKESSRTANYFKS